jgi:hypothetical protein
MDSLQIQVLVRKEMQMREIHVGVYCYVTRFVFICYGPEPPGPGPFMGDLA